MTSAPCSRASNANVRIFSALAVISPTKKCDWAKAKVTVSCVFLVLLASVEGVILGLSVSFDIFIVPIDILFKI